jgi:putative oxidoreductase
MLAIGKNQNTPAGRRYVMRTMAFMAGYTAVNVAAIFGAFDEIIGRPVAWALALAVAAPVAGQIWATLMLMRDSDEFVRALVAKLFILSAGIAMALATAWGFGESYAGAPHIPAWLIYPLFWVVFGLVAPFVRSSQS